MVALMTIPTLYEASQGSGSLIQAAYRQNVKGTMINPLSALQWVHLTRMAYDSCRDNTIFSWDDPVSRANKGRLLCRKFEELLAGYDNKVNEEGVAPPPMKKARRGRKADDKRIGV